MSRSFERTFSKLAALQVKRRKWKRAVWVIEKLPLETWFRNAVFRELEWQMGTR